MIKHIAVIVAVCAVLGLTGIARGAGLQYNDPLTTNQWYLSQLHFNEAWEAISNLAQRGDVTVAVIDSGFQTNHADLSNNLNGGINIVDGTGNLAPVHPHGTGTAGLPGSVSGNALGISQSALFAEVMPIRVSNRNDGGAFISDIAAGIRYAADNGARVINISYSGVDNPALEVAAAYAWAKGSVVFMAAGNDGLKHNEWANHPHLIAVGATASTGQMAGFSTKGKFVDIVAPGASIMTLYTDDQFAWWSGTSFSSPIAASVAALMLTANPELSPSEVDMLLRATAVDPAAGVEANRASIRAQIKRMKNPMRKLVLRNKIQRMSDRVDNIREVWGAGRIDALAAVEAAIAFEGSWTAGSGETYVPNNPSDYIGLVGGAANTLAQPQGFLESFGGSTIPEPGTILLVLTAMPLLLSRKPRRPHA